MTSQQQPLLCPLKSTAEGDALVCQVKNETEIGIGNEQDIDSEKECVLGICKDTELFVFVQGILDAEEPATTTTSAAEGTDDEVLAASLGKSYGIGTLVTSSRRVLWVPNGDNQDNKQAVELSFRQLNMHAVCREVQLSDRSCIYCQVDLREQGQEENENLCEVRFVPQDSEEVSNAFLALSKGASLFPDSDDEEDPAESSAAEMMAMMANGMDINGSCGGIVTADSASPFFPTEQVTCIDSGELQSTQGWGAALSESERQAMLDHWDSLLVVPQSTGAEEGQFDDADLEPASMKFAEPPGPPPS